MKRPADGFTFVEMLVAASLMAIVGGVMVSSLAGGIHLWQRGAEFGVGQSSTFIAFDRLQRDLHNLRHFMPVPFDGAYDRFSAAAAEAVAGSDPEAPLAMGRLGYFLRERDHVLCRSFTPYPRVRTRSLTDACEPVLERVARVRFSYFGKNPETKTQEWSEHWRGGTRAPSAMKVELAIQEGGRDPATRLWVVIMQQGREEPTPDDANKT